MRNAFRIRIAFIIETIELWYFSIRFTRLLPKAWMLSNHFFQLKMTSNIVYGSGTQHTEYHRCWRHKVTKTLFPTEIIIMSVIEIILPCFLLQMTNPSIMFTVCYVASIQCWLWIKRKTIFFSSRIFTICVLFFFSHLSFSIFI